MIRDYFKLNNLFVPRLEDGFSLDTLMLEKEIEKQRGINLSSNDFSGVDDKFLLGFVPFFAVEDMDKIKKLTEKYPSIKGPCSMLVNTVEELSEHMINAYQMSFFNYVLGRKNQTSLPSLKCKRFSMNLVLSLIEEGYPNAAYTEGRISDHAYVLLPFVLENEKEKIQGTIIVDPTYDQLQFSNKIRNAVFIRLGSDWEYRDPVKGSDLFPDFVCSIDSIRKNKFYDIRGYHNSKEYFEKAFANPVKIRE